MPPIVDLVIGVPTSFIRYDKSLITWIDFEIKGVGKALLSYVILYMMTEIYTLSIDFGGSIAPEQFHKEVVA